MYAKAHEDDTATTEMGTDVIITGTTLNFPSQPAVGTMVTLKMIYAHINPWNL